MFLQLNQSYTEMKKTKKNVYFNKLLLLINGFMRIEKVEITWLSDVESKSPSKKERDEMRR